jgi:hypothetical protein
MPFVRRRPLLRAAVVGGAAYHVGKRSAEASAYRDQQDFEQQQYEQQQYAQQQYAQQYQPPPAAPTQQVDPQVAKIQQLAELHDSGALSDEEFAKAKARILGV